MHNKPSGIGRTGKKRPDFRSNLLPRNAADKAELQAIVKKLQIKPVELLRKGEKIFIDHYKGKTLTDAECIDAMEEHPILIERPIVVSGDQGVVARPTEKIKDLLT